MDPIKADEEEERRDTTLKLNIQSIDSERSSGNCVSDLYQLDTSYPGAQVKLEELFVQWLCMDSTQDLVRACISKAEQGIPVGFQQQQVPPRSPPARARKKPPAGNSPSLDGTLLSPSHQASKALPMDEESEHQDFTSLSSTIASNCSSFSSIPRFYAPLSTTGSSSSSSTSSRRKRAISRDLYAKRQTDISSAFEGFENGMPVDDFVSVTKDLCGFPSFFNAPLFRRISLLYRNKVEPKDGFAPQAPKVVSKDTFIRFWKDEIEPFDHVERFFRLVKQPDVDFILHSDFLPFLQELLTYHPGLDFLAGTPEFQEKYALSVVVRIFYTADRRHCGRILLRDLRKSNLVDAFNLVDEEEDINKVNCYFSYEHFYVLYCKFWELDTDHDFSLSRDDLMRYGGHSLTRAIVDRVFDHGKRPFGRIQKLTQDMKNSMNYEDFIYFMLSEEDKGTPMSLRYWFDLIDFHEDGVIRCDEMRYFYHQQMHRMECLGHEVVPFKDILCQLSDLICPETEGEFVLTDFTRPDKIRISGVFFNVLFNLSKFIAFEQRDPFMMRQQLAEPELTDWDRFARAEYARLAMEEEGQDDDASMDIDTMDGWYVSEDEADEDREDFLPTAAVAAAGTRGGGASGIAEAPF